MKLYRRPTKTQQKTPGDSSDEPKAAITKPKTKTETKKNASHQIPRQTTKTLKLLPSRKKKTIKSKKKDNLPTAVQARIDDHVRKMDSNMKRKIFSICSNTTIQQPTNPTNAVIGSSPTLSIIMEADRRFGNDVEICTNEFLSWYMTAGLEVQLVDTVDAFMLASSLVTTSFHDSVSIEDILKTIQNVPTSSMSADSPCKILKTTTKMTIGSTTIDRKDLYTLYPDKWLNDQVIHAYLGLLKAEHNDVNQMGCYVLPCFLASKWEAALDI
ncbi:uncharacterized protein LOC117339627 [Pecten maximus]|uniref:uncharacterized protein LOC117339627 n=1 Tax=Pecten maximus TaxID=6579 RepID=UPI0014591804|nr:uncharacterized protein LOC117339627 [Pecten maximus]XP_033757212.1 uncharacterized protein LOC117339627 [Pecten maximus]